MARRRTKKRSRKGAKKAGRKHGKGKGHIPLPILEKRLRRLARIVASRGGRG